MSTTSANNSILFHERTRLKVELQNARENFAYWKRQSVLRTDPAARAQAAGLASAWQSTLAAKQTALAAVTA